MIVQQCSDLGAAMHHCPAQAERCKMRFRCAGKATTTNSPVHSALFPNIVAVNFQTQPASAAYPGPQIETPTRYAGVLLV
jgi:hypothetical protein